MRRRTIPLGDMETRRRTRAFCMNAIGVCLLVMAALLVFAAYAKAITEALS